MERDIPPLGAGTIQVEVHSSLVSPGTEVRGWKAFSALRREGGDAAQEKPFGYSNAGVVKAVGEGVQDFSPGDRVACVGGGYAQHTDVAVVPHNLAVRLPKEVSFDQGAYAMLAATGLQAVRRGDATLGSYVAVVGLGLVGQLTAQLHRLSGCYVIGWDTIPRRVEIARSLGIGTVTVGSEDPVAASRSFTAGAGLDEAVIAFGGNADAAMDSVIKALKVSPDGHAMGVIVVVGGATFEYKGWLTNMDVRRASRTGPGYHDESWEVGGPYPPVFMRWTTRTNLELCVRLIAEGRLKVDALTTHTIKLADIDAETSLMLESPDDVLGVVIRMR